jgi:hypothetical protein
MAKTGPRTPDAQREQLRVLRQHMAREARAAAADAGQQLSKALNAGLVSTGLRIAEPLSDLLTDAGEGLGDLLAGIFNAADGAGDDAYDDKDTDKDKNGDER